MYQHLVKITDEEYFSIMKILQLLKAKKNVREYSKYSPLVFLTTTVHEHTSRLYIERALWEYDNLIIDSVKDQKLSIIDKVLFIINQRRTGRWFYKHGKSN